MNSVWLKLLVFLLPVKGLTAEIRFSEQAKLYLLTTSPGSSIDRSWGHSAIWFIDSLNYIDFVFEYTSTEKNNFVSTLKMLFGKDIYLLRATNLEKYRSEIPEQHQTISYQLISDHKSNIELIYYDLVDELKQKTSYPYSLSSQNCSLLIFDHIRSLYKQGNDLSSKSIRDIFRSDGQLSFWQELFVIDILPSSNADHKLSKLDPITPQYLERLFQNKAKPQVKTKHFKIIFQALICLLLTVLLSTYAPKLYLHVLFLLTGLMGSVLAIIFYSTDEFLFQTNHQLLWLNPFSLLGLVLRRRASHTFLLVMTILLLVSMIISFNNGHFRTPLLTVLLWVVIGNGIILKKEFQKQRIYHVQ